VDILRGMCGQLFHVRAFNGASEPTSLGSRNRFRNLRAQSYGHLAEAFRNGLISIPSNPDLLDELSMVTYEHDEQGRMIITPKDQTRAHTGKSPDLADALSMLWTEQPIQRIQYTLRPIMEEEETW